LVALSSQAAVDTYKAHCSVVAVNAASQTVAVKQDAVSELGWLARAINDKADGSNIQKGKFTVTLVYW